MNALVLKEAWRVDSEGFPAGTVVVSTWADVEAVAAKWPLRVSGFAWKILVVELPDGTLREVHSSALAPNGERYTSSQTATLLYGAGAAKEGST